MMDSHTLSSRLKQLLIDEKHTDCSFRINGSILRSHKILLSAASPVFEAMLYGPMANDNSIEIEDINLEIFQMMLLFIYSDEIDIAHLTIDDLMELFYCAEKYLIPSLQHKCLALIKLSLRHGNILRAVDMAVFINIAELINICMDFFNKYCLTSSNFISIILHNNFHMSKECLNYILRCNIKQQNINLSHLIKEWCKIEANHRGIDEGSTDSLIKDLDIPDDLLDDVININSITVSDNSLKNSQRSWILCQRTYYKAVRPLQIRDEPVYKTSLISDRFIAIRSLIINSRLTPDIRNCPKTYTEQLSVRISNNDDVMCVQKMMICNVDYNSNVYCAFENAVILTPNISYAIEFRWDEYCTNDFEYPRSVFPQKEIMNLCTLTFDANIENRLYNEHGNILNGLEYVILS